MFFKKQDKILEIGSNDGFLTKKFIDKGYKTKGVDPSKAMSEIAKKNQVETYNMLFNSNNVQKIIEDFGKVDGVIANNVLNHANDTEDFIRSVSEILKDKG